ncbi:MAG TPA: glycosyltransferase family 9 protein [Chryseosolibacter sp.]
MANWKDCKNLLCVRMDNMGDVLMSAPAISSLKDTFHCKITLLTSSMGAPIAPYISAIDDVIVFDVPWMKNDGVAQEDAFTGIVENLRERNFDGAVIFNVFSQNPFASILLTWLAKIPRRAAYSRENPYHLLTDWVPDPEPYSMIRHQVKRDLDLAKAIGAFTYDKTIPLRIQPERWENVQQKLSNLGLDLNKPWLILHPAVSESKREFPKERWIEVGKKIVSDLNHQLIITGSASDQELTTTIANGIGRRAFAAAGVLTIAEFILLLHQTPLVISVNTVTIHIASATNTKTIVLYALTNPQHTPWKTIGRIFPYTLQETKRSKNEVLNFVNQKYFTTPFELPTAAEIVTAAFELLTDVKPSLIPELVGTRQSIPA